MEDRAITDVKVLAQEESTVKRALQFQMAMKVDLATYLIFSRLKMARGVCAAALDFFLEMSAHARSRNWRLACESLSSVEHKVCIQLSSFSHYPV